MWEALLIWMIGLTRRWVIITMAVVIMALGPCRHTVKGVAEPNRDHRQPIITALWVDIVEKLREDQAAFCLQDQIHAA